MSGLLVHEWIERVGGAEHVDLHGVVDDQLDGHERVDLARVAAQLGHRVAHRGEVDDAGHAGEVLQDHARRREGDLLGGLGLGVPPGDLQDVVLGDRAVALGPQQVLEQDLQRVGQPGNLGEPLRGQRRQAEVLHIAPAAQLEGASRAEGVYGRHR